MGVAEDALIRYALIGLIQGLTEFLPVSSSGHLVLAQRWLGVEPPGVLLEALLHWGTLAAILVVYRRDLLEFTRIFSRRGTFERRREAGLILAGSVPIAVFGLLVRSRIEAAFSSPLAVGAALLATAALLAIGGRLSHRAQRQTVRFVDALAVGAAQAAALFPGISRSGSTIVTGMTMGVDARRSTRFSFLLAIPALFGAGLYSIADAARSGTLSAAPWLGLLIGTIVAFLVGWAAIRLLLRIIARGRLWTFGIYCAALGTAVIIHSTIA